ncbi:hypothetical protein QJS66_20930 [Kocuria rhizophila]|nr:hypothetical protein QJS66_20930 [Kocuria rhizophila]
MGAAALGAHLIDVGNSLRHLAGHLRPPRHGPDFCRHRLRVLAPRPRDRAQRTAALRLRKAAKDASAPGVRLLPTCAPRW